MSNEKLRVLAIIPARGGSKGLPGKNIKTLAGLPLIAHSIRFARLCPEISRTIVSTDSPQIAEVAKQHGGDVPFLRPAELAKDDTPMWPVLRHALKTVEGEGDIYDAILLLDPTTPARLPEDITGSYRLLASRPDADAVIGVSQPEFNPLWNCWTAVDGVLKPVDEASRKYVRRQDVPIVYRINASLYFWRTSYVREEADTWRDGKMLAYEVPEFRSIHIDDSHEFQKAETLIEADFIKMPWLEKGSLRK